MNGIVCNVTKEEEYGFMNNLPKDLKEEYEYLTINEQVRDFA